MLRLVWRPENIETFEAAVRDGLLEEKHDFDAKRELPSSGKELAKDVAAMTTDGGVLVYGVGEDENGHPNQLCPMPLSGAAERIDQIVQTSISGNPRLEFIHLRLPQDSGRGYLVVLVPASPDAPHQVTVGDDRRFYGRSPTGNRRLSEAEIARLYERRASQNVDRSALLQECIDQSPLGPPEAGNEAFLHAFVRPAVPDDDLWMRASSAAGGQDMLLQRMRQAVGAAGSGLSWGGITLKGAVNWMRRGADTWSLDTSDRWDANPPRSDAIARMDVRMDGAASLFAGGAADRREELFVAYERGIAITLTEFFAALGVLYREGGLYGFADAGMAITGLRGATSSFVTGPFVFERPVYQENSARRALRLDVQDLTNNPRGVTHSLTERFVAALSGRDDLDPLAA
jgi:hypothetical protein